MRRRVNICPRMNARCVYMCVCACAYKYVIMRFCVYVRIQKPSPNHGLIPLREYELPWLYRVIERIDMPVSYIDFSIYQPATNGVHPGPYLMGRRGKQRSRVVPCGNF